MVTNKHPLNDYGLRMFLGFRLLAQERKFTLLKPAEILNPTSGINTVKYEYK